MWTPRRIAILFLALFGFGGLYAAYDRFLGRIDGLPVLPLQYLAHDDQPLPEMAAVESPTLVRLREAFGDNCPEMGAAYPTRLEIREQGVVFAAGMPQIGSEPTKFVKLAPLSVALFAKPKPPHEQVPGEATEISTMHADEGILEFDRPIASDRDMLSGKAKMIAIELRSNPDPHNTDPRNGRIVIANNQKSHDPGKFFVMKTPGPVYYRTADHPESANPQLPQIWTAASVEIANRANLPRPLRGTALPVVAMPTDDAIDDRLVADMVLGKHTAPPTVTAVGLKLFMKKSPPNAGKKGKDGGFSGVREMVLAEQVHFSFWTDGAGGFPGSDAKPAAKVEPGDPSIAHAGLAGGLHDAFLLAERVRTKSLVRVKTLGSFRFDFSSNIARFDIAPQADPLVPNNVEMVRFANAAKDHLVCQKLEIEFNGPVTGASNGTKNGGPAFKRLDATGEHVFLSASAEQFQAQGTALRYESDLAARRSTTTLTGAPLSAVRKQNVLMGGQQGRPATLVFATVEPPPGVKQPKVTEILIDGPGKIAMFDEISREKTLTATWAKSLTQTREMEAGQPLDKLVFAGDGEFLDAQGRFQLKADLLNLWLKAGDGSTMVPHKLQGIGSVNGSGADAVIENTDVLTVLFVDVAKPMVAAVPPPVVASALPSTTPTVAPPVVKPVAEKGPPNPVRMSARSIDVTLHRMIDANPKAPSKYEMREAHCTDRVVVRQPSQDLRKSPVGIDIRSAGLVMKQQVSGHAMTVLGAPGELAKVRFENTTICGPAVEIDQAANLVKVQGGGWMSMPSSSNLAGAAVDQKSVITIHWASRMKFLGERKWAEFVGQVQAVQQFPDGAIVKGPTLSRTSVACHELNVTFDRPIHFNQFKRDGQPGGDPKVKSIVCSPASEDGEQPGGSPRVLYLEEATDKTTKQLVKATQIEAKLLEVTIDDDKNVVTAGGPGVCRLLQMGTKELTNAANPPAKAESEMKLTLVRFNGRLNLTDQKGIFQKAVFREHVRVVQVPTANLNLPLEEGAALPPRSLKLKCNDIFTVTSYRSKKPGIEDERTMEAVDGAEIKTDDYLGLGHTITFDGSQVILRGYGDGQATLYRRERDTETQDHKSGNPLIYNTKTKQISGAESTGGQFSVPK